MSTKHIHVHVGDSGSFDAAGGTVYSGSLTRINGDISKLKGLAAQLPNLVSAGASKDELIRISDRIELANRNLRRELDL